MASTIVVSGGVGKLALDGVAGRLIVRPLTIPAAWTTIRIATYIQFDAPAAPALGNGDWQVGLCRGTTNCYGDASTTHYVGAGTNGVQAWTNNANHHYPNNLYPQKRVGTTSTIGTAFAGTAYIPSNVLVPWTRWFFVDITKGSPNYSIRLFDCSSLNATDYITLPYHYLLAETHTPSHTHHTYRAAQTIAVNEAVDGTLDAAMMYLNLAATLWVYDFAVLVMA